jgi:hypothetical protein
MEWFNNNDARFYHHGKYGVDYYNKQVLSRREKYPFENRNIYSEEIREFNEQGFKIFKNALSHDLIDSILDKTDYFIKNGKNLKSHDQHMSAVNQPYLQSNECFQLATSDLLVDFATEYFDCVPALGTCNLRKSYLNNLPPTTTQLFHCDKNCIKFFKFFVYLGDVDTPEEGPLTLVRGSLNKRPTHHGVKHRWTEEEIKNLYGQDSLIYLTAKKGDLIAATTTAYHRGTKPLAKERTMFTMNYVIHPELAGGRPGEPEKFFNIKQEQYDSLPDDKKPLTDFLIKV